MDHGRIRLQGLHPAAVARGGSVHHEPKRGGVHKPPENVNGDGPHYHFSWFVNIPPRISQVRPGGIPPALARGLATSLVLTRKIPYNPKLTIILS